VIHSAKPFDWAKELKELIPEVTETRHGGLVVCKLPKDNPLTLSLGTAQLCFFTPDGRTVVFDTEEALGRLIDHKPGDAPAWAAEFKRVERGIAAIVLDNRNNALGRELAPRENPESIIAPFQKHANWSVFGVSTDKDLVCDAALRFDSEEIAGKAVKEINGQLDAVDEALQTPNILQAALDDGTGGTALISRLTAYELLKNLLHKPELTRDGATVRLRCRAKCDISEVLAAILEGEIGL
jgi:hypothetical protein